MNTILCLVEVICEIVQLSFLLLYYTVLFYNYYMVYYYNISMKKKNDKTTFMHIQWETILMTLNNKLIQIWL